MSESIVIARPDASSLASQADRYIKGASALVVTDDSKRVQALTTARELRSLSKQITAHFEPARAALESAKKEILRARASLTAPIDGAVSIIDQKCQAFEAEEKRKSDIERARLEYEAEAERQRLLAEAVARQEEQRLMDAAMAETETEAEDALTEPLPEPEVYVPPVVMAPVVSKVEGVSKRTTWKAEVHDKAAFLRFVADNPMVHYLVEPNMVALNSLARQKADGDVCEMGIDGVRGIQESHRAFGR